jgi:hypothetical protein
MIIYKFIKFNIDILKLMLIISITLVLFIWSLPLNILKLLSK